MIFFGRMIRGTLLGSILWAVRGAHFTLTPDKGFSGVRRFRDGFRERDGLTVVDRAVRIGLRRLTASEGAAFTQSGFRHSIHGSLALIHGQIVFDAWGKTGNEDRLISCNETQDYDPPCPMERENRRRNLL
jgi:hypothetical protein